MGVSGPGEEALLGLEGFAYEILSEEDGATDDDIPYLDLVIDDMDTAKWLKRVRIFAIPNAVVRFEFTGDHESTVPDVEILNPAVDEIHILRPESGVRVAIPGCESVDRDTFGMGELPADSQQAVPLDRREDTIPQ